MEDPGPPQDGRGATGDPVQMTPESAREPHQQAHANVDLLAQDPGPHRDGSRRPFFTSLQWTADGTSLLATRSDNAVAAYVLPADLLQVDADAAPRQLQPQATTQLPEPAQAIASAPYFSLADPASQTFLAGCRDHPIHLYNAFPNPAAGSSAVTAAPVTSYKLIRKETEEYITPSSMLWQAPGTHFICGSSNRVDYFDMSRHGSDGPLLTIPTIPSKRHISKGSGVGMKGTVSALAGSPVDADGGSIVAAGTWTRWMGLYDLQRSDKIVANWSIAGADREGFQTDLQGQGIVQLLWSPCGRYLMVNERHAQGLLVYDVRGSGKILTVLRGRAAKTQQKLLCDVYQGDPYGTSGAEVWAGTEDGSVSVWDGVGMQYGVQEPSWSWDAHAAPVGAAAVHSSGSVVATCSGGWKYVSDGDLDPDASAAGSPDDGCRVLDESALKVWSIKGPG